MPLEAEYCDYRWVAEELKRWTFAPNFKVEAERDGRWGVPDQYGTRVVVKMRVPDVRPPHTEVVVEGVRALSFMESRAAFPHWLRSFIRDLVVHEADEWLKRDGVAVFDPHAR